MTTEMKTVYVQADRVNVRREPRIEDGNIVAGFVKGDPLEVLVYRAEQSPDGWVWRQLVDSDKHWVAEYNTDFPEFRLLDTEKPDIHAESGSETVVTMTGLRLRSGPQIANNVLETLPSGTKLALVAGVKELGSLGWVWRKLADRDSAWAAEYNARTGERLLETLPETKVLEPATQPKKPSVPVTTDPVQPAVVVTKGRVRISGRKFLLDGQPFRFTGANLREFPFYARSDVLPHAKEGHQRDQLNTMKDMKMRVVRMHVCHRNVSVQDALPLVRKALDLVHSYDMVAIVVLNDALGTFWVPGDERFHVHALGHLDKTAYFHQEGYRENYLPYLRKMVETYKDHPAIFAWELGNEYAIHPQPCSGADSEAFLRFAQVASDTIRSLDASHLITIGLVNTGHVAPNDGTGVDRITFGKKLYGLPNIDFATVHFYGDNSEEQNSLPDVEIMKQVNKPLIVEEWGTPEGSRSEQTASKMEFWIASGAQGFMQWGLSATPFDIGVGDNKHGMDPYAPGNRNHYHGLLQTYRGWSERLMNT